MTFHKYISIILHPIVIPTVGAMLYFLVVPNNYLREQKFTVLSFIFVVTYLIPLFMILFLKRIKIIKTYKIETVRERKLPVVLMLLLFYFLANSLDSILLLRDLSLLFYATALGLFIVYLLLYINFKTSIHLLSLGISTGFFLILTEIYNQSFLPIIIIVILLSGILAKARLQLKAHNQKEVYVGYFLGIISMFTTYLIL